MTNPRLFCAAVLAALLLDAAELPAERAAGAGPARPNIVILLADDVGFSDIGCYGGEIHTPNLDALAAEGLRFTQFYNTSRCCPSRTSLLTGLYSHQAGVGHMTDGFSQTVSDGYVGDLNEHCVTIAQVLKTAGYGTYAVGKWHVTKEIAPDAADKHNWPLHRGFDRYYGTIMGRGASSIRPCCAGGTRHQPVRRPRVPAPGGAAVLLYGCHRRPGVPVHPGA